MRYLIHIMGAIFFFSVCTCGSTHKHKTVEKTSDSTKKLTSTITDTIPNIPPFLKPGPGPGNVQLRGKILSSKAASNDSSLIYKIKVIQVLGIGAATPPVGDDTILHLLATGRSERIPNGTFVDCTIQQRQIIKKKDHKNDNRYWVLLYLRKYSDHK